MKFYGMFVVRNHEPTSPEIVDCWDEWTRDGNEEGFAEKWAQVRAEDDILGSAIVEFTLNENDLMGMILPVHKAEATGLRAN
jgi:hypothetical protein